MYSKGYLERVQLFKDAIALKQPARTPNMSNFFTWKICDSDYSFRDAIYDYDVMKQVVVDFHNRYDFDAYMDLGTRNPIRVTDALGGGSHCLNEEGTGINVVDDVLIQPEEYEAFAADPKAFSRKCFQRKYPNVNSMMMMQAIGEYMQFGKYAGTMTQTMARQYERPTVFDMPGAMLCPTEFFTNGIRGLKGLSIDMRRHKEPLKAALDAYFEYFIYPNFKAQLQKDSSVYVTDFYTALLSYSIMSPQQFEKFYWPYLKKMVDEVVEADKTMLMFCESTMIRFKDFFQEIPKGHVVLQMELDDLFEVREALPDACLCGGLSTDLLSRGTAEECVDTAKRLIDGMGDGFILSQNRMMSFANDCKRENMLAVNEYIHSMDNFSGVDDAPAEPEPAAPAPDPEAMAAVMAKWAEKSQALMGVESYTDAWWDGVTDAIEPLPEAARTGFMANFINTCLQQ